VAYAPSSLAVAHCCFSSTLDLDFLALKMAYEADAKSRLATTNSTIVTRSEPATSRVRRVSNSVRTRPQGQPPVPPDLEEIIPARIWSRDITPTNTDSLVTANADSLSAHIRNTTPAGNTLYDTINDITNNEVP
jgi:hypothetical protein